MIQRLIVLLLAVLWLPALVYSQGRRPEVLVYGDGLDAYAAAVQAARSRLHTIWVWESPTLPEVIGLQAGPISSHDRLDSGIWGRLLAKTLGLDAPNDSAAARIKQHINPRLIYNAMEAELAELPHLKVVTGRTLRSVRSGKRNWQIELDNRQRYRVRAVVDATMEGRLAQLLGQPQAEPLLRVDSAYFGSAGVSDPLRRTGVAVSDLGTTNPYTTPMAALLPKGEHRLLFTKNNAVLRNRLGGANEDLPLLAHAGQAVGALAGYIAFYKTTTDKITVRQVQGELLQYDARLLPYQDIPIEDPHFRAIQMVGLTGLFPASLGSGGSYLFEPERGLGSQDLAPVMNQLFSRSQIWFTDNQMEHMTLADLMSLIKYVGQRGNELDKQIQQGWTKTFGFEGSFDPERPVTRRQTAVLLNTFVKPFDVQIGTRGQVVR